MKWIKSRSSCKNCEKVNKKIAAEREIHEALLKTMMEKAQEADDELQKVIESERLSLEKEAVYWKEKALSFKRFHQ